MITSLGKEGAARIADRSSVRLDFVVLRVSTLSLGTRGGLQCLIVALPGYLFKEQNANTKFRRCAGGRLGRPRVLGYITF